jgi:predicted MFS family arabinose efflux permease
MALYLATNFNWHLTYWLFLIFGLFLLAFIFSKIKPIDKHLELGKKENRIKHSIKIIGNRRYWTVFSNNVLLVLGDVMFMTFSSAYCTNNLGVSLQDLPLLFGIGGIATLILGPIIGQLTDTYGKLKIFIIGTTLTIIMVAVFSHLDSSISSWIVVSLHTLIFIGINARMIASTALATVVPDQPDRGAFMTLDASFQQVAGGVAATGAGLIVYQATDGIIHGYPLLGLVVMLVMLVTIGLMYKINQIVKENS